MNKENMFETLPDDAMNFAAAEGNTEKIKKLLKKGKRIPKDMIVYASSNNRIGIVKLLIKNKFNVNIESGRALTSSFLNKNHEVIKLLLKNGADKELLFNYLLNLLLGACIDKDRFLRYLFPTKELKVILPDIYKRLKIHTK